MRRKTTSAWVESGVLSVDSVTGVVAGIRQPPGSLAGRVGQAGRLAAKTHKPLLNQLNPLNHLNLSVPRDRSPA